MTQRDKWSERPCVMKYWAFKDEVLLNNVEVPESGSKVIFRVPMPKSWSKKKKAEMVGKPHQQKPDVDNLLKALLDAIYDDDAHIWDIHAVKLWDVEGSIEVLTSNIQNEYKDC